MNDNFIKRLSNKIDKSFNQPRYPNCIGCTRTKHSCDRHIKCTKHENNKGHTIEWK